MADPLSLVPEDSKFNGLRWMLSRLQADFQQDYDGLANQDERIQGWVDEIASGKGRDADQIRDDIVKHIIGVEAAMAKYGIDEATFDKLVLGGNEGGINFGDLPKAPATQTNPNATPSGDGVIDADPQTLPGLLSGGQTIVVKTEEGDRFYQTYEFPPGSGQFMSFQFNDEAMAIATLGAGFDRVTRTEQWYNQNVLAEGSAEEAVGDGSFQRFTDEIMRDAAVAAGIRDPGMIGRIASNVEMRQIMAQSIAGDWSPQQVLAAQRQTSFWTDELYPGIERFYGSTTDPERAWAAYRDEVAPQLRQLGYEPDANGQFLTQIESMLDGNIDAQTFNSQVPIFIQATQNAEFASVLNQWAERDLGRSVGFNDWFDLIAGESIPELDQVAENARLAYTAQQQGSNVSDAQIASLAGRTNLSDAQARQAFSEFNQSILALGDEHLARGDLTRQDVLDASAGTGGSVDAVRQKVAKLAREVGAFDDDKIDFYVGFNARGQPNRPGLSSLAPESA